jgi:flagellar basal-body rod protein FlgB
VRFDLCAPTCARRRVRARARSEVFAERPFPSGAPVALSEIVLPSAIALTLLAAAATTPPDASTAPLLPFTERLQRIPLATPPARLEFEVLPLARRIILKGPTEVLAPLSRTLRPGPTALCAPVGPPSGKELELRCTTALLSAQLEPDGSGALLVIRQLRAVPFAATVDAPEPYTMPEVIDPFDDPASLRAVANADAALRAGDPIAALGFLKKVRLLSSIGRLAALRIAELDGSALEGPLDETLWDPVGLPTAWATDLRAHQLRVLALRGDLEAAMAILLRQSDVCAAQRALCLSVLWRGLEDDSDGARLDALTAYASIALEDKSALGLQLGPRACSPRTPRRCRARCWSRTCSRWPATSHRPMIRCAWRQYSTTPRPASPPRSPRARRGSAWRGSPVGAPSRSPPPSPCRSSRRAPSRKISPPRRSPAPAPGARHDRSRRAADPQPAPQASSEARRHRRVHDDEGRSRPMKLFDSTLNLLSRSLDARLLRQNVIAGNLANANTPGFVPLDVDVEKALQSQVTALPSAASTDGRHIPVSHPSASEAGLTHAEGTTAGLDGNAVDVDRTLASLAQNALQYTAATRAAGKKLAILRFVASDGAA